MTKYVVSGYIGFDNFGDEAIASVLVDRLKNSGAEEITLISSNPVKTEKIHGVKSCKMLGFIPPLYKSDVLISGGGSLLQDVTSIKSLIYYLGVIYAALLLHKRVEIFAQGIGPINSKIGEFLVKRILKKAAFVSVRDKNSQELLHSWGITSELVKDPVFDIKIKKQEVKGVVGVQLRDFKGVDAAFLTKLADTVSERFADKRIKIISLQDSVDLKICEQFFEMLKERDLKEVQVLSGLSLDSAIEAISGLEYLIGMRFHANVAAINSGVKILCINYDPKVQRLAEEYGLPYINLADENFSPEFDKLLS